MTCVFKTIIRATLTVGYDGLCSLGEQVTSGQGLYVTLEGTESDLRKALQKMEGLAEKSQSWQEAHAELQAILSDSKVRLVMLEDTNKALSGIISTAFEEADRATLRLRVLKEFFAKLINEQDLLISSQEQGLNDNESQLAEQAERMALQHADTILCLEEMKMKFEDDSVAKDTIIGRLASANETLLIKADELERVGCDLQDSKDTIKLLTTDLHTLQEAAENLEKKANATIETLGLELDAERGVSETLRHEKTRLVGELRELRATSDRAENVSMATIERLEGELQGVIAGKGKGDESSKAALQRLSAEVEGVRSELRKAEAEKTTPKAEATRLKKEADDAKATAEKTKEHWRKNLKELKAETQAKKECEAALCELQDNTAAQAEAKDATLAEYAALLSVKETSLCEQASKMKKLQALLNQANTEHEASLCELQQKCAMEAAAKDAILSKQALDMQRVETQLQQLREELNKAHREYEATLAAALTKPLPACAPVKRCSPRSNSPGPAPLTTSDSDSVVEESPLVSAPRPPPVVGDYRSKAFAAALGDIKQASRPKDQGDAKAEAPTDRVAAQRLRIQTGPMSGGRIAQTGGRGHDNERLHRPPNGPHGPHNGYNGPRDYRRPNCPAGGASPSTAPPSSTAEGNDSHTTSRRSRPRHRRNDY